MLYDLEKEDLISIIKNSDYGDLEALAREIRDFLVEKVSKTGGHLASNLGVVELTMAMHLAFDFPKDQVVWDVGHQSYTHKLLTGRRAGFDDLRKYGGMSGFPKRKESDCDCFDTGHSSTSISAGIGFIALFGICIQNGVIMISDIKNNLRERHPLEDSIKMSVKSRVRSVLMTASMAAIGLLPAALSHGIGSESQRPLAIVIIGGLIGATFFTLFVFPLMVEAFYRRMLYDKNGKLVQRRL